MMRLIFAGSVVISAVSMFSQSPPQGSAFQQPGWIAAPGSSRVNYPTLRLEAQAGPVTGRPLSATELRRTEQTLADGTRVQDSSNSRFYRDVQGRMRSESSAKAMIFDPVAGYTYQLDLANKTYERTPTRGSVSIAASGNTTTFDNPATPRPANPPQSGGSAPGKAEHKALVTSIHAHAENEDLTAQMLNGVYCKGSRITETIPAGTFGNDRDIKIVSERWYSDDLQVLVKSANSDPRFGVTTYELTNIVQAAPDAALFQVPADYRQRSTVRLELAPGVPGK